jgi:hypothetical protein
MLLEKCHGRLDRHDISKQDVNMNARPQIREKLLELKMNRWALIAKYPSIDRKCTAARARKNFWRLCQRYPAIMKRLGLSVLSVYK